MILTSIVIGLAFSVLTLVQKHMLSVQLNFKHQTELNKLEQSLWLDMNRFSRVEFNTIEDVITFKNDIDSVIYYFNEKHIIKDIDTFNIRLKHKILFFNGNKITEGMLDGIKLETSEEFQNQILFVFKENDATYFVNHGI
ncbi:hypothetical protein CLV33_1047 [Jejuia pallidilutea]|uniref:Uncharacterized protein n=2 Tax=Jejuia pallidilutea TaxID=504487 RepID=A0A362X6N1_9FLAO|nr:hypothetical protein CLV33_1047 [Jejuia pallidilutea]